MGIKLGICFAMPIKVLMWAAHIKYDLGIYNIAAVHILLLLLPVYILE